MRTIPLTNSEAVALVDDCDYDHLMQFKWRLQKGKTNRVGYAVRNGIGSRGQKTVIAMHLVIFGLDRSDICDHRDRNSLNNQRANLRACTHAQNLRNRLRPKNNTSGYKGVFANGEMWRGQCRAFGVKQTKTFATPEAAHAWYCEIAKQGHGDFFSPG